MARMVSVSALLCFFGSIAAAAAQTPATAETKWEVEVHLGGAFGNQPAGGTPIGTFPVGEAFTTTLGRPSRYASTWYFGDGAALLNRIVEGFGTTFAARITPLDPVLTRAGVERKRGLGLGARVSRRLTRRLAAEFSVDSVAGSLDLRRSALDGIEATRASFQPVWDRIIGTGGGSFTNGQTSSTSTFTDGTSSRLTALTGALNVALSEGTRLTPYLTAGAGVRIRSGDLPTARLLGSYGFTLLTLGPFQETDVILVRFTEKDTTPVGVFGGGVKYALSPRQGLRADVRVHVGPNSINTHVDTLPGRVVGGPPFVRLSATTPSLVLSNTASVRSNLTGPPIDDLKTFTGSGADIQTSLTVGYYLRLPAAPVSGGVAAPRTPRAPLTGGKWEMEGHAGGAFGSLPTTGTPIAAFPVGGSLSTVGGLSSRYASTWYFGDGAALINQIAAGFIGSSAATTRVTPLDPVLTTASLERSRGPSVGFRLARRFTPTVSAEVAVDTAGETWRLTETALSGIEATRASFTPMWNALIATGSTLFLSPVVSSDSVPRTKTDGRQTLVTGAVTFERPLNRRLVPYATAGGGVSMRSGALPSATLLGDYQFRFSGVAPFKESDLVLMHFTLKDDVPVGFVGGGVKYAFGERQGLRVDVRVHLSPHALDTLVNARPEQVLGTPAFSIASFTSPSLVFSNSPAVRSNLTGPAIVDLKTFTGSGRDVQTNLTVGYYVRF